MNWTRTIHTDQLTENKPIIFKSGTRQVVILQRNKKLFAFDNRCPHEGYPLSEGTVDEDCILTCNWHNWKFNLSDGSNLRPRDGLRTFPVRLEDGLVMVDLSPKSSEALAKEAMASLEEAFNERHYDRIARVLARLYYDKLPVTTALEQSILWAHDRLEYGMTHALAVAADWLALYDRYDQDPEHQLVFMTEAVDHLAHDALRFPIFAFNEEVKPYSPQSFLDSIEAENEARAIAELNGALASGLGIEELEPVLLTAALTHYYDFGHSLIYVKKAGQLIRRLGKKVEKAVLRALVRSMIHATREDLLPEFKMYAPKTIHAQKLEIGKKSPQPIPTIPRAMSVNKAMDFVYDSLKSHSPDQVLDSLLEAAGANLLFFDLGYTRQHDLPVKKNVNWLTLTHAVTFANAVRSLCRQHPQHWPAALMQTACFIGRVSHYLDTSQPAEPWLVKDPHQFMADSLEKVLDHGLIHPIYSCHLIKTWCAVEEELGFLPENQTQALLAGLNRYIHSPIKEKFVRRTIHQAKSLVGKDYT